MTETVDATDRSARPTLAFVGAGRAGSALALGLHSAGHRIVAVHSHTPRHAARLAEATGAVVAPTAAQAARRAAITFATVPDSQIVAVAATIAASGMPLRGRALVHCSASSGPEVLAAARITGASLGAFHPLQALAGPQSARLLRGTTFTIEAAEPLVASLHALASDLGGHVLHVPPGSRELYHAAAVLAGSAPLVLLARATTLLEGAGVETAQAHRALVALLAGAASNAREVGPTAALTGPVIRGDAATVARHLDALAADPSTRELYRRLGLEVVALVGLEGREQVADTLAAVVPGRPQRVTPSIIAHPRVA